MVDVAVAGSVVRAGVRLTVLNGWLCLSEDLLVRARRRRPTFGKVLRIVGMERALVEIDGGKWWMSRTRHSDAPHGPIEEWEINEEA